MKYQINVLSFNRPEYLKKVLESLAANDLADCEVRLWQDGCYNPFSKRTCSTPDIERMCLNTFFEYFPGSMVTLMGDNKGIGLSYKLMKELTFSEVDVGIFLEDDLVLSKDYIAILKKINEQIEESEIDYDHYIGSITAYGPDRKVGDLEQCLKYDQLEFGIPSWGYMLRKDAWLKRKDILNKYYSLISEVDYRFRNDKQILNEWISPNGFTVTSTSQDTADTMAMILSGQIKLSTCTRNAEYIGKFGQSANAETFDSDYYGKDKIFPYYGIPSFVLPSIEELRTLNKRARSIGYA